MEFSSFFLDAARRTSVISYCDGGHGVGVLVGGFVGVEPRDGRAITAHRGHCAALAIRGRTLRGSVADGICARTVHLGAACGLLKEELDALTHGSRFSFGDLMADRAGVRVARAASASEPEALALQARLQAGYAVDDFFPPAADLPENLTMEQFRRAYDGVGTPRYRQTVREIDTRLNRCAVLASP
jgi:hypothetical protein